MMLARQNPVEEIWTAPAEPIRDIWNVIHGVAGKGRSLTLFISGE